MDAEVKAYISTRYNRFLDYSLYHCSKAGIDDQAYDILNEVLVYLLEKDSGKLERLYKTKKGQYRELDFFVLRMIKLNVYSPTSPYQNKYKPIPADNDVDFRNLNIKDTDFDEFDKSAFLLSKFNLVRATFEQLQLSEKARQVFTHRFFLDLPFSEWEGNENKKELYDIYRRVSMLIKERINGRSLI